MQEIDISLYEIFDCLVLFFYLLRERKREREKCLEAENMKTLKRLRAFFFGFMGLICSNMKLVGLGICFSAISISKQEFSQAQRFVKIVL